MVELSRRFFLGGAISLAAAQTFKPVLAFGSTPERPLISSNHPVIYGDGFNDDSGGLNALLRNDPVIFEKDMIGVDSHGGLTFHHGMFRINQTLIVPSKTEVNIEFVSFEEGNIDRKHPFIRFERETTYIAFKKNAAFITNNPRVPFVEFA